MGRRFKIGTLTLTGLILAYSMINWYHSDRHLNVQSFKLPESIKLPDSIKLGSWSDILPARPSQLASLSTAAVPSSTANALPQNASDARDASASSLPRVNQTTGGINEEIIKPSTDDASAVRHPTIGKMTIMFGDDNPTYERALKTHEVHNRLHGYPVYVLRQEILYDVWTKPAYILSVLLKELTKPESERLKWLLWFDADTVLMNPNIPLDMFLPPEEFDHIHLMVTNDFNGLNNGVFPIRVHPWSVSLMSAIVAFPTFRPDVELVFRDQSALDEVLKEEPFRDHVFRLPQRWFNAYPAGALNETMQAYQVRRGDLLVHFAGLPDREKYMEHWLDIAEQHLPEWELDIIHSSYPGEIREFWSERHAEAEAAREQLRSAKVAAHELLQLNEMQLNAFRDQLPENEVRLIEQRVEELRRTVSDGDHDVDSIHEALDALHTARPNLLRLVEQAKRDIIKAAYVVIYESESDVVHVDDPALEAEVHYMEQRMESLRQLLVERPDDTETIHRETEELRRVSAALAPKIQMHRNAVQNLPVDGETHPDTSNPADGEMDPLNSTPAPGASHEQSEPEHEQQPQPPEQQRPYDPEYPSE